MIVLAYQWLALPYAQSAMTQQAQHSKLPRSIESRANKYLSSEECSNHRAICQPGALVTCQDLHDCSLSWRKRTIQLYVAGLYARTGCLFSPPDHMAANVLDEHQVCRTDTCLLLSSRLVSSYASI